MAKGLRIFPECHADTLFVKLLTEKSNIKHCSGINNVALAMKKPENANEFIVGVVDTDKFKRIEPYIGKFLMLDDRRQDFNLCVFKHPENNHHAIRLHPAFEKWIWSLAVKCDIDPSSAHFGFQSVDELKSATKTADVYEHVQFKRFVRAVIDKNPPEIQLIKHWLSKAY